MKQKYQEYSLELARVAIEFLKRRKQVIASTFEIQWAAGGAGEKDDGTSVKESRQAEWGRNLKRDRVELAITEQLSSISTVDCISGRSRASIWKLSEGT